MPTGIYEIYVYSSSQKIWYHLTLVKIAIIKKSTNNKCWKGCEEKGTLLHTVGGNVNWCSHYGEQYRGSLKTKNTVRTAL